MQIPAAKDQFLFSDADADLRELPWRITEYGYLVWRPVVQGKTQNHIAHRVVMSRVIGRTLGRLEFVDHRNFNKLDCRRENLQVVSPAENSQHRRPQHGFVRGTTFHKRSQRWRAQVKHQGRCHYCGQFDTQADAAKAAAEKRKELGFYTGEMKAVGSAPTSRVA